MFRSASLAWIGLFLFTALVSLTGAAQVSNDLTVAVASALSAKEFDKALALLEPALAHTPENPKLWTLQALALSGKNDKKAALAAYQKALKASPDFLPALEGAAQIEYETGDPHAAPLLQHLLRLRPNDPTAHAMLAVIEARKDDCSHAVSDFAETAALIDTQPELREEYATCLFKTKQADKAIDLYQRALAAAPADNEIRYRLAVAQFMAEKPNDTLQTLTPVLQADEPPAKNLQLAAAAYESTGNTPLAVQTLRRAIVADPHDVGLYLDFAVLSLDHQSYQVGIDMIDAGLRAEPKAAPLYVARGVLNVQLAKYDDASADFEKAETLQPNQTLASVAQGLEQAEAKDLNGALSTVQKKLARQPNDAYLLYLQADILAQQGPQPGSPNFQTALRSAKRAVTLQPSLVSARDILAKLYLQSGQTALAIQQSREALRLDPKDQTALYRLIQALRATQDKKELPGLLKRLADLRAESTRAEMERNRYTLVESDKTKSPQ